MLDRAGSNVALATGLVCLGLGLVALTLAGVVLRRRAVIVSTVEIRGLDALSEPLSEPSVTNGHTPVVVTGFPSVSLDNDRRAVRWPSP